MAHVSDVTTSQNDTANGCSTNLNFLNFLNFKFQFIFIFAVLLKFKFESFTQQPLAPGRLTGPKESVKFDIDLQQILLALDAALLGQAHKSLRLGLA